MFVLVIYADKGNVEVLYEEDGSTMDIWFEEGRTLIVDNETYEGCVELYGQRQGIYRGLTHREFPKHIVLSKII